MLAETVKYSTLTILAVLIVGQIAGRSGSQQPAGPSPMTAAPPKASAPSMAPTPAPQPAVDQAALNQPVSALDEYTILADSRGHFYDTALINGQQIRVLVDTGASAVALSYEDASSLLIFPLESEFTIAVNTANGTARAAPVKLRELQLGGIKLYDVDAIVAEKGVMQGSLLGMTFLSRLSHVEMASGLLQLRK
jgi:aspartyl protease family protein